MTDENDTKETKPADQAGSADPPSPSESAGIPAPPSSAPAANAPAGAQAKTNTMAILSLVFSFFFQLLGLIFGIVALKQIKEKGEGGKGLAVAGIVISIVGMLFFLFWVALFGLAIIAGENSDIGDSVEQAIEEAAEEGGTVGDPVAIDTFTNAGDLRVKANSVKEYGGREFFKPEAGSIYLNVELEIENEGFETKYISPTVQMYIKDDSNQKYNADILSVPENSSEVSGELPSKESVKGVVGFEVPESAKGLKLYVEDGSFTDTQIAVIDLGR